MNRMKKNMTEAGDEMTDAAGMQQRPVYIG
jgi:hypothetical protein